MCQSTDQHLQLFSLISIENSETIVKVKVEKKWHGSLIIENISLEYNRKLQTTIKHCILCNSSDISPNSKLCKRSIWTIWWWARLPVTEFWIILLLRIFYKQQSSRKTRVHFRCNHAKLHFIWTTDHAIHSFIRSLYKTKYNENIVMGTWRDVIEDTVINNKREPWKKVTMSKDENKSEEDFVSCQEHLLCSSFFLGFFSSSVQKV